MHILTAVLAAGLVLGTANYAHAVAILADGVSSFFDPDNETQPHLQLDGAAAGEDADGAAVFTTGFGTSTFTMEVDFLSASEPDSYDGIFVTAALNPEVDYTGVSVELAFGGDSGTIMSTEFKDAETEFGLPFPPGGIRGIGNGAGGSFSLNGALVAGWDLETDLIRGVNNPLSVDITISGIGQTDQAIRFDVFGYDVNSPAIVMGNNPNSGLAVTRPIPEADSVVLLVAGLAVVLIAGRKLAPELS